MVAFFAGLGLPGLSGFIREAFCFIGGFTVFRFLTVIGTLGILLNAVYFLRAYQRIFWGEEGASSKELTDINLREIFILIPLLLLVIGLGIYPAPLIDIIEPAETRISDDNAVSGKIVNISSIGGRKGARGRSAYRAAKAGLINLTESVAAEVKTQGIDVNCICPGGVDTEGFREAFKNRGRADIPSLMLPEEIAELVLFLASDQSTAVTGTAIDAFGTTNPLFE